MMSLEARGVLKNKFKEPFRRRRPWQVDWSEDGNVKFNDPTKPYNDKMYEREPD